MNEVTRYKSRQLLGSCSRESRWHCKDSLKTGHTANSSPAKPRLTPHHLNGQKAKLFLTGKLILKRVSQHKQFFWGLPHLETKTGQQSYAFQKYRGRTKLRFSQVQRNYMGKYGKIICWCFPWHPTLAPASRAWGTFLKAGRWGWIFRRKQPWWPQPPRNLSHPPSKPGTPLAFTAALSASSHSTPCTGGCIKSFEKLP